jgi:eukaryotic-like serine/threonine-protein kinase
MRIRLPKIPRIDLKRFAPQDPDTARFVIVASVAVVALMAVSGIAAFFLSLRGAEKTMVPDVRGKDLVAALVELQDKELYPQVQQRYSDASDERGRILEQNPRPGAIVKAGRRVKLVVSRGAVVDRVENFIGQSLTEVKLHLQTLFTSSAVPLLAVREPPAYVFDPSPAGTVIAQKPLPDARLSKPTVLELVVSRGPEKEKLIVPALIGKRADEALALLAESKITFSFTSRKAEGTEVPYTVVSQLPAAGASIPAATRLAIVVSEPTKTKDSVFGILKQALPEYPYPLKLGVKAILPSGDEQTVFEGLHSGGDFSIPYLLPTGSQLVLSILDQEKFRMEVK